MMKRNNQILWMLFVTSSLFFTCVADAKVRKWNEKMQELGATFSDLLPELADSKPVTPAAQKKLLRGARKLQDLAHTINMGDSVKPNPLPPEMDPTIRYVSGMFEREVKVANRALEAGHVGYAKSALRQVTGFCIACHTRHDLGPDFPGMSLKPNTNSLTPMEKAELLAATRQFDAALDAFQAIAADRLFALSNPIQWGRAVHTGFALAIRVKRNPDVALSILEKVESLPEIPAFYSIHVPKWKKSLQAWKGESPKSLLTEDALLAEAIRLDKAAKKMQEYPTDRAADVLYLRATAALHELLTKYPNGRNETEALYYAGTAYDLLQDRATATMPDLYYESCVRSAPHTAIAQKCYERFEQNMLFGYSGSAGTYVPDDVQKLMKELKMIARKK